MARTNFTAFSDKEVLKDSDKEASLNWEDYFQVVSMESFEHRDSRTTKSTIKPQTQPQTLSHAPLQVPQAPQQAPQQVKNVQPGHV